MLDFEAVLRLDPENHNAEVELDAIHQMIEVGGEEGEDFGGQNPSEDQFPSIDHHAKDVNYGSDSGTSGE